MPGFTCYKLEGQQQPPNLVLFLYVGNYLRNLRKCQPIFSYLCHKWFLPRRKRRFPASNVFAVFHKTLKFFCTSIPDSRELHFRGLTSCWLVFDNLRLSSTRMHFLEHSSLRCRPESTNLHTWNAEGQNNAQVSPSLRCPQPSNLYL